MSKNKVIPLCSWRDVPIPQRCEGCPYTECCFSSLDGKTVKKCPHDIGLGLR